MDFDVESAAFPILGPFIRSVNDTWFAVPFEREEWISSDFDPNNKAVFKTALGGMSGSPVFVMHRPGLPVAASNESPFYSSGASAAGS